MTKTTSSAAIRPATTKERIDSAAYALFSRRGIRDVGIDEVISRCGVAKATLYRHYPSKTQLALAFLRRREELWTRRWLQSAVEHEGGTAAERLLRVFDVFDKWFRRSGFEGCSFINVLLETSAHDHPVRLAAVAHLAAIRAYLAQLAKEAGIATPEALARQWHVLMKGSIVAAAEGDRQAALRAREIGALLLKHAQSGCGAKKSACAPRKRRA